MGKAIIPVEPGSEKGFALVFALVFAVIGFYPLLVDSSLRIWSLLIAVALLAIGFVKPSLLRLPNLWWFKLGMALGAVVAPIVMALVYLVVIVPTGLILRLMGKDLLNSKIEKGRKSYWIERSTPLQPFKNQF